MLTLPVLAAFQAGADPAPASLQVFAADRGPQTIPKEITGKFCENLSPGRGWQPDALGNNINKGDNIYNGMEAQVLRNPTFGALRVPRANGHRRGVDSPL